MLFRNDGTGESNIIQNRFTKYLQTAVQRRKDAYLEDKELQRKLESLVDFQRKEAWEAPEQDLLEHLDFMEQIDNEELLLVLLGLKKRELEILQAHVLQRMEYKELARMLGIGYKGVSAAYSRTIKKIRKELGGEGTE